jgi:hypothetical protein
VNAGYSGTPLAKKLGLKAGRVCLLGAPAGYRKLLEPVPEGIAFTTRLSGTCDFVQIFTKSRVELGKLLATCRKALPPDASIWVSWPKKASKVPTDITEDTVRELALPLGLVDIKVCAVDETWSGLKLVLRRELRGKK